MPARSSRRRGRAIHKGRLEVDHRKTGSHAAILGALQTLLHAGHELSWHRATDHRVLELETRTGFQGLEHDLDPRELAGTTGLLLVGIVDLGLPRDGLAVGYLGR